MKEILTGRFGIVRLCCALSIVLALCLVPHANVAVARFAPSGAVYTVLVESSQTPLSRGDTIDVTLKVLRYGVPSELGPGYVEIRAQTSPDVDQEPDHPIVLPAERIHDERSQATSTVTYTFTAASPGTVTFAVSIEGEGTFDGPGGQPVYAPTFALGRSQEVTVLDQWAHAVMLPAVRR